MPNSAVRQPFGNVDGDKGKVVNSLRNIAKKTYTEPNVYEANLRDTKAWLQRRDMKLDYQYHTEAQKENDADSVDYTIRDRNGKILEAETNQDVATVIEQLANFIDKRMDTYSTVMTFN